MTGPDPASHTYSSALERYLAAQLAGDAPLALRQLNDLIDAGHAPAEIRRCVVREAQREIGRLWQSDRITVAQEHSATAVGQVALSHLFGRSRFAARRGERIVVACVAGELHDFPARLVADELEIAGFDVTFLGTDAPPATVIEELRNLEPAWLALSVTMLFNCGSARRTIEAVRDACPGVRIAIGGGGLQQCMDADGGFGADATISRPEELVALLTSPRNPGP